MTGALKVLIYCTQPLAQLIYLLHPAVHHAPYLHGNQAPPPPTQQAAHRPWQPTMHHATDRDGLQSLTSATTPSTMFQQGQLITKRNTLAAIGG